MKRGRGIDFELRFRTSRWAEDLLIQSLGKDKQLLTVRYGLSEIRAREELEYDRAGYKEPDLIVLPLNALDAAEVRALEGTDISNANRDRLGQGGDLRFVLEKALAALEVEFSPYRASEMKGRGWKPKTPEQWDKRPLKHANPPTAPNIWVKEEDLERLIAWQTATAVPIVVAHVFDQEAFAIPLRRLEQFEEEYTEKPEDRFKLQVTSGIFKKLQRYDRVDAQGASEQKTVYVTTPAAGMKLGDVQGVDVKTQLDISASKKYVSHTLFSGGKLDASPAFIALLQGLRS